MFQQRLLPLFPLRTVLFPGGMLPLYVFEERYKRMIGECLTGDRTFGVSLIRSGVEVGGPADPYEIGTTAQIVEVKPLGGGRMALLTVGVQRYRLLEIVQASPYLVGRVILLDDDHSPVDAALVEEVAGLYLQLSRSLPPGSGVSELRPELLEEPLVLSYFVAGALGVPTGEKQRLLELDSVEERLKREASLLRHELEFLRLIKSHPRQGGSHSPFSVN